VWAQVGAADLSGPFGLYQRFNPARYFFAGVALFVAPFFAADDG
jgi:hypothetical protein